MPVRKCVSLEAVFDDGTVERASGDGLADWWREAVNHNGECEFEGVEWETTRLLQAQATPVATEREV